MKLQAFQRTILTSLSHSDSLIWNRVVSTMLLLLLLTVLCQTSLAQENFLVATADGTFSLYDLTSLSLLESFQSAPLTYTITSGPDPRLAYSAGGAGYGVAIDTTIERDIVRFSGVKAPASTMGANGKYYLAADYNFVLDVVDSATLAVVRTIDFSSIIPRSGNPGAIVAANNKAFIFPRNQRPYAPRVAVVDLSTFQLSSISLPPGTFCRRCASRLPDESMVVVFEVERADGLAHLIFINTTTNTIAADFPQIDAFKILAFRITPNGNDPSQMFGYIASDGNVWAVDLRPGSQSYGQILFDNKVGLSNYQVDELAISSDGSRVIAAQLPYAAPPMPNVDIVDAQKLISDPSHALIGSLTVAGGIAAYTVCTGFFVTTPPNTAPTVTGLSTYHISNEQSHDITISGTNFQNGALVRIGSLPPLPTTFLGSTMLGLHVPQQVPAGAGQDVIVTNPMTNSPANQQNQSGLLAGKFNVLPNPTFQPTTQFGIGNPSVPYVYDLKQQTMVSVPTGAPDDVLYGITFNQDGKYLYLLPLQNYSGIFYILPVNLSTNMPGNPIAFPVDVYSGGTIPPLGAARDPQKNTPVVYAGWTDSDLHLSKVDSNPSSPTFNTIVQTFDAGLDSAPLLEALTVSPDNKFAYGWYYDGSNSLGIFNLSTGSFTSVSGNSLGINSNQNESQVYVSPDGKSLLLANTKANRTRIKVFDLSNPTSPKSFLELTPVPISGRGAPLVNNYEVVGNKLYGIDLTGAVVVFNFDRSKGDFRERGWVASSSMENYSAFGFSADGLYLYIADYFGDLVLVADTSKLASGGDPTLTNIRSPYTPSLLGVSPVPPPLRAATAKKSSQQHRLVSQREQSQISSEP
jgi:hypothetical protein